MKANKNYLYSYVYKGQVVRNSNRIYEFALVNHNDIVIACSSTEKGALKEKTSRIKLCDHNIEYWVQKGKEDKADVYRQEMAKVEMWHTVKLKRIDNKTKEEGRC